MGPEPSYTVQRLLALDSGGFRTQNSRREVLKLISPFTGIQWTSEPSGAWRGSELGHVCTPSPALAQTKGTRAGITGELKTGVPNDVKPEWF